jgi:hypothetical protein
VAALKVLNNESGRNAVGTVLLPTRNYGTHPSVMDLWPRIAGAGKCKITRDRVSTRSVLLRGTATWTSGYPSGYPVPIVIALSLGEARMGRQQYSDVASPGPHFQATSSWILSEVSRK